MCGIVGAFSYAADSFDVSASYIKLMRDTMIHRGPDAASIWISENHKVGLGHRRLSIIDLSEAATQPMSNEDDTLWITFNGEIYNHAEIKKELEATGKHKWKTNHSDTEVILHAFEEWGIDCLHKFRGVFAFAIWDEAKGELWLVRDRIGVKPLYYSIQNGRIIFASEIKALLKDPGIKRRVDEKSLFHFLSFLTTPAPDTLFEGIKKIPCGRWLRINRHGEIREEQYWDVMDHTSNLDGLSESDLARKILDELKTAVTLRKVSDVPVGVFLSGGIDSSINTVLFSEGEDSKVKSFTIGYEGEYKSYSNENKYAKQMADFSGAEYHEKLLTIDDLLDFLPGMIRLQDEPIADPVCVPVYYVSKLARDNQVVVCQVGEGADELYWGYRGWRFALRLQQLNNIPFMSLPKNILLSLLKVMGKDKTGYYEYLRRGVNNQPVFWGGAEAFTNIQKHHLLSLRLKKKFANYTSWEALKPIRERFEQKAQDKSPLNWMTYLDLNLRLPELLLMRVDKMSMGVSLEGRVPFLDHKFVELSMSIPQSLKTKHNVLKYMLKKSVRGLIPDQIIDRKKQGFGVPVYEWLFDKLGEKTVKELNEFCDKTDYLDKKEVMRYVQSKNGPKVWCLLNLALWHKEYFD